MRSWPLRVALGAFLVLGWSAAAHAQANQYELNMHVGSLRYDIVERSDTDFMLGARFLLSPGGTWGFGGNFDWVNADEDVSLYLYSGELNYTFPSQGPGKFFVAGGLGARTLKIDFADLDESRTRLAVPLGAGFKWLNRPSVPSWAIRAELRDHIVFGDEDKGEKSTENTWEFSGGISLFF